MACGYWLSEVQIEMEIYETTANQSTRELQSLFRQEKALHDLYLFIFHFISFRFILFCYFFGGPRKTVIIIIYARLLVSFKDSQATAAPANSPSNLIAKNDVIATFSTAITAVCPKKFHAKLQSISCRFYFFLLSFYSV